MARVGVVCLFTLVVVGVLSCVPPDCDHPDCGSCANPCCEIEFMFNKLKPDEVFEAMIKSFKKGGADGRYTLVGYYNYTDVPHREANYVMQGIHTTKVNHYNDTVNYAIYPTANGNSSRVKIFSISNIYGAFCDEGQNYKNVVGYVKGLNVEFEQKVVFGCVGHN